MILNEEMVRTLPVITEEELKDCRYSREEIIDEVMAEADMMLEQIEKECGYDSSKQAFSRHLKDS